MRVRSRARRLRGRTGIRLIYLSSALADLRSRQESRLSTLTPFLPLVGFDLVEAVESVAVGAAFAAGGDSPPQPMVPVSARRIPDARVRKGEKALPGGLKLIVLKVPKKVMHSTSEKNFPATEAYLMAGPARPWPAITSRHRRHVRWRFFWSTSESYAKGCDDRALVLEKRLQKIGGTARASWFFSTDGSLHGPWALILNLLIIIR